MAKQQLARARIARRLALPVLLLGACIACLVVASQLGASRSLNSDPTAVPAAEALLISGRRLPEAVAAGAVDRVLGDEIAEAQANLSPLSCAIVLVDGRVVYSLRPDQDLAPGHSLLALTAHAAIDRLGPRRSFLTQVLVEDRPTADGRVAGNLYLVGGGDPIFMTYNHARSFRPILITRTAPEELAAQLVDAGLTQVDGGVVGVESRFDSERSLSGWPVSYLESGAIGPLSALQVNDGLVNRAAAAGGVAERAENPAVHAAGVFDDELERLGVVISQPAAGVDVEAGIPDLVPFGTVKSAPLADIMFQMLAVNDAGAAELVNKELGFDAVSRGTTRAGLEVLLDVALEAGASLDETPSDASGLDPSTRISCVDLAAMITGIPEDHATLESLPSVGLPGVFEPLKGTEMVTDMRLVGGVVGRASGLVGRTVNESSTVAVATIINREGGPSSADLEFQRSLITSLDLVAASVDPAVIEAVPSQ